MTVKETKLHGHRIYTLELDTIEKLGGNLDDHFKEMFSPTPSGVILQKLKEKVNTFFENSSKIVDENGEPLVVYHGTPNHGFTVFDTKRQGERDHGDFGKGFYFTPSKEYAKTYTLPGYLNFGGDASKVYAVFINMREPLYHNAYWGSPGYVDEQAHDGIIVGNDKYEELPYSHPKNFSEIVAVKPNQIKSATENRGTFDGGDADITHSLAQDDDALDGVGGMEMASAHALAALEARADEAYAAQLAREFRRKAEAWSLARVRGDEKEGRLGRGAKLFGELMALVDAAELTLGAAAQTGRLHFLLAWARVYAGMMENSSRKYT